MERRILGETGEALSIVGFGGIVVMGMAQSEADRTVRAAIDRGINYFDVAPTYGDAQDRLGPALAGHRDGLFLACKTAERDRTGAQRELESSLKALGTDHFDLYQLHGLATMADLEQAMGPGGALEALAAAREHGQARHLGFSAHSAEVALEALRRFPFDSVLFPINFVTYLQADFGPQVVAEAQKRGAGRLALKALARAPWREGQLRRWSKCWYEPLEDPGLMDLALRFTLSLPVTAAIPPGEADLFWQAVAIAERFRPLAPEEAAQLQAMAETLEPLFRLAA